jgi:aminoglycoside phosphotransferase family enzyme
MDVALALRDPASYDEEVEKITVLQTHISFVFLTGKHVYKVKKPVDFGFLDFTTLENRRHFCEEELRLNRRLCEDLYLGVVPINESGGNIKINGPGETVEYALKMRELPQSAIMSRLLEGGKVTAVHVAKIARILSKFHNEAGTGEGIDEYGALKQARANWVENFEQTRGLRGVLIDAGEFDFVETEILRFMEQNIALFDERVRDGRIRECHGDCHTGNIFIIGDGTIYIFDAIEFNKAFSCSDVAAEVAFLAMDLEFNGRVDLKDVFVKKYIEESGDTAIPALLPFYICYRAYVRSKVTSFKLGDPNIGEGDKKEAEKLTLDYFKLALAYARELRD